MKKFLTLVLATYGTDVLGTYQMRGFAADPNGKYYFGGNLSKTDTIYVSNVLDIPEKPVPVEETVAEVVDTAAGETVAPQTFDAGVIAAVAAVVSAAGYAISKKSISKKSISKKR